MTARAAEVRGERVAALLPRAVDGAERDDEAAAVAPARGDQAEVRVPGEVAHQPVERVGPVERRQPHLVRGRSVARQPPNGEVEQRLLLAGSAAAAAGPSRAGTCTSAMPNGRIPGGSPRCGGPVRPAGGGPDT